MSDHILNLINQILCYADPGVTDNPHQRAIDHRLRLEAIAVKNPYGTALDLAPGQSFSMFSNIIATGLDNTSVVGISLLNAEQSRYRLSVASGAGSFRTARSVSGITTCVVAVNNNSLATFNFAGSTLTAVQVGDIMRIKGDATFDTGPFAFNPINSGLWKVIGKSGTIISAVRQIGEAFTAVAETPASAVTNDVSFYADDKVRPGQMFEISNTFSPASFNTYEVADSTPTTIDFISTNTIPTESGLTYISGSVVLYTGVKRLVYIEADEKCSVRFNGQTDDLNKITPIKSGDRYLRGFLNKFGDTYSCEIVNQSLNTCSIRFFTVE